MKSSSSKKIKASFKTLLIIFLVFAAIILTYSIIELRQSKKELSQLMKEESHSLLESLISASNNALLSYETIDSEMKYRLLNNANFIKLLFEKNQISQSLIEQIAEENNIYRINIFDRNGRKLFSNHTPDHTQLAEKFSPIDFLHPIFNNDVDTLLLGTKEARFEHGYRFAVAISTKNNGAVVLNLDAKEYLQFRKTIGFGALLKDVTKNEGIIYAVLQNLNGIIAASGNLSTINEINNDDFLLKVNESSNFNTRIISSDTLNVFEAVHPFNYKNEQIGLLRIGLSANPLINIEKSNYERMLILGLVILLFGSALFAYIFSKQNFDVLQKEYKIIEDYSQKILQNVSDAIIVLDANNKIKTFNKAAELLFNKNISKLFSSEKFTSLLNNNLSLFPFATKVNNENKHLLISKSSFETDENNSNTIILIRDLTKQKMIEDQLNRKERVVAMGELASGVAHEIRNPLNTISTITQQLNKDFEPIENSDEFHSLAKLVNKEIVRINKTINEFLRFSKPTNISLQEFMLSDLINQLEIQYASMFRDKNITFIKAQNWDGKVNWDKNQIQQVLMNLIQNSYDAIGSEGKISLILHMKENNVVLNIKDNGNGIPTHIQDEIFNLYHTTKASGTGIGLSIVQKIVYEHRGTIEFDSKENEGTKFIIILPINPTLN